MDDNQIDTHEGRQGVCVGDGQSGHHQFADKELKSIAPIHDLPHELSKRSIVYREAQLPEFKTCCFHVVLIQADGRNDWMMTPALKLPSYSKERMKVAL
jgi:hypothetical protein